MTLTASYLIAGTTFEVTVDPPAQQPITSGFGLSDVSVSPGMILSGQSGIGEVTLTGKATSPITVALSSSNPAVLSVPASVVVPKRSSSATFSATTGSISAATAVTITASYGGLNSTFTVIINLPAPASASFQRFDTTTQGNWKGTYNYNNVTIVGDAASNASYTTPVPSQDIYKLWSSTTTDVRAPERVTSNARIAASWFSTSPFYVDINFTDQSVHQVAIYTLDWSSVGGGETIEVLDANTNAVLDTRTLSAFNLGVYVVWNVTGHVKLQLSPSGRANAAISGVFLN
ncbi:MAG TPA: hypothetical protein VMH80_27485 [Bryobacteraceae bacterium]|nr:hypothetical protein [Bryobacteraceae bacterium]